MRDYNDKQYKIFRQLVRKRDKGYCKWPNCNSKRKIHVHHILCWSKYISLRYTVSNGICLCKKHHDLVRHKEEIYAPMFIGIINET